MTDQLRCCGIEWQGFLDFLEHTRDIHLDKFQVQPNVASVYVRYRHGEIDLHIHVGLSIGVRFGSEETQQLCIRLQNGVGLRSPQFMPVDHKVARPHVGFQKVVGLKQDSRDVVVLVFVRERAEATEGLALRVFPPWYGCRLLMIALYLLSTPGRRRSTLASYLLSVVVQIGN